MNHMKNFTKSFGQMNELMLMPATVYSDNVVDATETETKTFLWDVDDADTNVVLSRTVEYDATPAKVSETAWALTNGPTVSAVVTDQATNTEVLLNGETVLTITGTNFGAEDDDLEVLLYAPLRDGARGPHPVAATTRYREAFKAVPCVITAVNGGDTEITATVDLGNFRIYGGAVVDSGACFVEVRNIKRHLKSDRFEGLEVVS